MMIIDYKFDYLFTTDNQQDRRRENMVVDTENYIQQQVIKNLLQAHCRAADREDVDSLIMLSKFILRLSKHVSKKSLDFRLEECNQSTEYPPDKSKKDVPDFKGSFF